MARELARAGGEVDAGGDILEGVEDGVGGGKGSLFFFPIDR